MLNNIKASMFQIFNTLVRASSEAREAVLQYFARIISLNVKRAGTHVCTSFYNNRRGSPFSRLSLRQWLLT